MAAESTINRLGRWFFMALALVIFVSIAAPALKPFLGAVLIAGMFVGSAALMFKRDGRPRKDAIGALSGRVARPNLAIVPQAFLAAFALSDLLAISDADTQAQLTNILFLALVLGVAWAIVCRTSSRAFDAMNAVVALPALLIVLRTLWTGDECVAAISSEAKTFLIGALVISTAVAALLWVWKRFTFRKAKATHYLLAWFGLVELLSWVVAPAGIDISQDLLESPLYLVIVAGGVLAAVVAMTANPTGGMALVGLALALLGVYLLGVEIGLVDGDSTGCDTDPYQAAFIFTFAITVVLWGGAGADRTNTH